MDDPTLLPPVPHMPRRADRRDTQRLRLFRALAEIVSDEGWGAVSVSKLAARAGVSTRAFYEHFADKEACLLEAYDTMTTTAIAHMRAQAGGNGRAGGRQEESRSDWREELARSLEAWFDLLAREPHFTRIYAIEIWSVSPATQRHARAGTHALVDGLRAANRAAHDEDPAVAMLDEDELQMLAGGIHRLVVLAAIDGRIEQLRQSAPAAIRVATAGVSRLDTQPQVWQSPETETFPS